jgi:5-methylcytosine-specific restriction endonuclease McrA
VLERDRYRCVVCGVDVSASGAARIDHKKRVSDGGAFWDPDNLRSLCSLHDNQSHSEKGNRSLEREERFTIVGCDASGMPLDPSHPWAKR